MKRILALTNLYPSALAPGKGIFNFHKFNALASLVELNLFVPVQWRDWQASTCYQLEPRTGIPTTYFPYYYPPKLGRRFYGDFMYQSLRPLIQRIEALNVDAILASYAYPDAYAGMKLSHKLDLPLVTALHGSDINVHIQSKPRRKRLLQLLHASSAVVSVSQNLISRLAAQGIDEEKCHVIYNGVDLAQFHPADRYEAQMALKLDVQKQHILFVGNVLESKGVLDLINAFATTAQTHPAAQLQIVGGGADANRAKQLVAKHGLGSRVTFNGQQSHSTLPNWLAACQLLCLPSYREGVPNVVLEATACGRPVVASNVGGIPEVTASANALLVNPGDSPALATALSRCLAQQWDPLAIAESCVAGTWTENATQLSRVLANV